MTPDKLTRLEELLHELMMAGPHTEITVTSIKHLREQVTRRRRRAERTA
jgi:hypothetical protein